MRNRSPSTAPELGNRLTLFLFLGLLAGFAWLTRHPDAPILREAESWPLVGRAATWFRNSYLPPARGAGTDSREATSREAPRDPAGLESPAAGAPGAPPPAPEVIWILPGEVLRNEPAANAEALLEFRSVAGAIKLERAGDWFRVRHRGNEGWVLLEGYHEGGDPPYGDAPDPPTALMPRPPDETALAAARELLGDRERVSRLGPYKLYTDCRDDDLLDHLGSLASQVESLYSARYGRLPLGSPKAELVLYRSELTYRLLESRSERISGLHSAGHASLGLAAFYVGERAGDEVGATLVHELGHLLNRRALGPALPPWIDEGLADDLAMAGAGADGKLDHRRLGGELRRADHEIRITGGLAALHRLRESLRAGTLPPLRTILDLDWDDFVRSPRRRLFYATSAFWIRFLVQGGEGRFVGPFRSFLAGVSRGEPATAQALLESLEEDLESLDEAFHGWIASETADLEP